MKLISLIIITVYLISAIVFTVFYIPVVEETVRESKIPYQGQFIEFEIYRDIYYRYSNILTAYNSDLDIEKFTQSNLTAFNTTTKTSKIHFEKYFLILIIITAIFGVLLLINYIIFKIRKPRWEATVEIKD